MTRHIKSIKTLMVLILALTTAACSDFTETTPKGKVIPTTTEDFREMVIDVTNSDAASTLANFCSDDYYSTTLTGNDSYGRAYYWMEDFYNEAEEDEAWNSCYERIYVMNTVINNVMSSTEGTETEKQQVLAEAKLWRAYYYWYLQSLYAKDYDETTASTDLSVPLSLTPDLEASLSRATVAQVTKQILSDLEGAEDYLPQTAANNYRPSKGSAYALKARVLFYQHKYDDAAQQAKLALQQNSQLCDMRTWSFVDESDPSNGINGRFTDYRQTPEKLWYLSNNFAEITTYYGYMSADLLSKFDPKDLRLKYNFSNIQYGEPLEDGQYIYLQELDYNLSVPEMMLIEAEALARSNDASCLTILNTLRTCRFMADDYKPLTTADGATLLDIVLDERRRELALTGLRWLDMKRLSAEGKYTKTLTREWNGVTHTLEPNSKLYVFPIPLQVRGLNSNIAPNDRTI